jgi:tetrahydromethanopterin S-methyltransferase subunit B
MDVFIGVVLGLSIASIIAIVLFCILTVDAGR